MNVPPPSGIRVPPEELRTLAAAIFEKAGTSRADAELIAKLLVLTDLRGVFSHGTRYTQSYTQMMLDGRVNPRPALRSLSQTDTTQVLDGDGGMGHFPCYHGTQWAIAQAKQHGLAALTTRNHFHFGAASKYSRMALEHDLIGLAISSHRFFPSPESNVLGAGGGSPMSIAIPAGDQPPLVLDMGAYFLPYSEDLFRQFPATFFKGLGLAALFQALGGILAGIYKPEVQAPLSKWESNQGSFIVMFDVKRFMPVDEFKQEMDRYIGDARRMKPLPGTERAELSGGLEWQRQQEYAREGIPVAPDHQKSLEEIAAQLGVPTPFARYTHTRFGA
ncbi:MAG: Ldh family oxidoreductase [Candidatus Latescibacteria bacterium]|nr:Ldh family oxidoreductase [Candidatus Latescibacterota bacterium]